MKVKVNKRRFVIGVIVFFGVVLFSFAAFAQGSPQYGGICRAAITTNPTTMDVHFSNKTVERQIAGYLHETLVTYDENYRIIPQLASSWEVSPNGLTYVFHLRRGVKFHNGKVLTASDVKASVERFIPVSPTGISLLDVSSINVIDPFTIEFKLASKFPLIVNLALPGTFLAIYPKEIIDKYKGEEIKGKDVIGTGPYKLAEWIPDVCVRLVRFEDYVSDDRFDGPSGFGGKRIPYFDEIRLIPVTESVSRVAGLESGAYDFIESVPVTSFDRLDKNPAIKVEIVKPKWGIILELNHKEPPMDNLQFRRALVAALDMTNVMEAVTFGDPRFYRTQPSIYYPEQKDWYTTTGGEVYNHKDPVKAKELLKAAGYHNEPIIFLSNQDFDWMYKCTLAVASQLQEVGINIQLEFMDWPSQLEKAFTREGWHINQTGWSPRFDPTQLMAQLLSTATAGYSSYSNPKMEHLLMQINTDEPIEKRYAIWQQIQKLVWDDVVHIRMGDYFETEAIVAKIEGYKPFYVIPRFWNCWFKK